MTESNRKDAQTELDVDQILDEVDEEIMHNLDTAKSILLPYVPITHAYMSQHEEWSDESLKLYNIDKMDELSNFIKIHQKCQLKEFRKNGQNLIWRKFDQRNRNKLNSKKYLPKLLY
eukprot:158556_1